MKERILKMKKKILLMLCLMMTLTMASCSNSQKTDDTADADTQAAEPVYEVLQDRVIEVTYEEYDFDKGAEYLADKYDNFDLGGCSAVKVLLDGKVYIGRNYDFYCSNSPAFIVRNNAGTIRTIGIGNSSLSLGEWTEDYELPDAVKDALPYLCCDVMSEAGIYAETNIRIGEEGMECVSTNSGAPRRCTQAFMQIMLSQYSTIEEIIAHIDDYDWFDLSAMGFNQAFMLCDQNGYSVVIEFAENSWKCTECDEHANYFIDEEYYAKENYPLGEMRIEKELEYKPNIQTPDDIFTMMETASYARFYKADTDPDYAIGEYLKELGYTRFNIDENREEARAKVKEMLEYYDAFSWDEQVANSCWESTFITVADVTDLKLTVHFSEHYGITFETGF